MLHQRQQQLSPHSVLYIYIYCTILYSLHTQSVRNWRSTLLLLLLLLLLLYTCAHHSERARAHPFIF